jgi:hypothetical protein
MGYSSLRSIEQTQSGEHFVVDWSRCSVHLCIISRIIPACTPSIRSKRSLPISFVSIAHDIKHKTHHAEHSETHRGVL